MAVTQNMHYLKQRAGRNECGEKKLAELNKTVLLFLLCLVFCLHVSPRAESFQAKRLIYLDL